MGRARRRTRARLQRTRTALQRERETARVLAEQADFMREVAADTAMREVVDPNPASRREAHASAQDRDRHAQLLHESTARIARLESELDALLDRLLAEETPT